MGENDRLKEQLEESYLELLRVKIKETREKGLTRQLIINFDKGKISNLRESNIIAGASVVDFFMSNMLV